MKEQLKEGERAGFIIQIPKKYAKLFDFVYTEDTMFNTKTPFFNESYYLGAYFHLPTFLNIPKEAYIVHNVIFYFDFEDNLRGGYSPTLTDVEILAVIEI